MPLWFGVSALWTRTIAQLQFPTHAQETLTLYNAALGLSGIVGAYLLKVVLRSEKNLDSLMQEIRGTPSQDGSPGTPGIAGNVRALLQGQEKHERSLERVDDNFRRVNDYVTSNTIRISAVEQDVTGMTRQIDQCPVHREESPMKGQRTHD